MSKICGSCRRSIWQKLWCVQALWWKLSIVQDLWRVQKVCGKIFGVFNKLCGTKVLKLMREELEYAEGGNSKPQMQVAIVNNLSHKFWRS
jgi:hypothetical protein